MRRLLGHERRQALLVRRVQVGVQEADRERRDAARAELAHGPARVGLVERRAHRAVRQDPLGHLADQPARHQRRGLLDLQIVDLVALLAPDDQHVAEAARGQESDAARLALDDDVRAERRAVHDLGRVAPGHAAPRDQRVEARQARLGRVRVRR
ncbi:MAG: hypothetical protein A3F92_02765 [Candidatus Rokubacteria bacterium RIFCSPLOWO2_12_FULL_71_22]|nr:MAG: hypothetical protein A3F92_02765 [Candidatus Rokubacteria bacterium RIFCSPLOWO2_12_FULL_71_22]